MTVPHELRVSAYNDHRRVTSAKREQLKE